MKTLIVKLTFLQDILGTAPNDEEIYANYIASKSPDASTISEEVAGKPATMDTSDGWIPP